MDTRTDQVKSQPNGIVRVLYFASEEDEQDDPVAELATEDGYEITVAEHTAAALDMLKTDSYDCVLSAYTLTQTDGLTFFEEVHRRWPTLSFILYTDDDSPGLIRNAFKTGITDYVSKSEVAEDLDVLRERLLAAIETNSNDTRSNRSEQKPIAEQRLSTFFDCFPDPMVHIEFVDGDAVVRNINPAFEETFGFDTTTLVGQSVGAFQIPTTEGHGVTDTSTERMTRVDTVVTRMTVDGPRSFRFLTLPIPLNNSKDEWYGIYISTGNAENSDQNTTLARPFLDQSLSETNTGVWVLDLDTDRLSCHDATAQLFGCEPDQIGPTFADLLSRVRPADRDRVNAELASARTKGSFDAEFRVRTVDGQNRWIHGRGTVVRETDGPGHLVGVFVDVTVYKQSEKELPRYEHIVQAAADPVFSLDEDWQFEFVNDAFVDVLGYDRANLLGEHISLVLDETDVVDLEAIVRAIDNSDIGRGIHECTLQTNYGTTRWFELNVARQSGNRFEGIVGIARDTTDRKRQEQQLQHQRDRFAALFESIPEPAVCVRFEDADPVVRNINDAFADLFGLDAENAVGKPLDSLIEPEGSDDARPELNQPGSDSGGTSAQVRRETEEGLRDFLFRSVPIETETNLTEYIGIYIDITDRNRTKNRLERERQRLDVLNRVMSHDIRNNLQVIIGYAETLEAELDGHHRDHAAKIRENAEDATALTRTADEFSDVLLRSGIDLEAVSLRNKLRTQIDRIEDRFEDAVIDIDGAVPETEVMADELLDSVFRNLLRNAVQHNDKEIPEITVSVEEAGDNAVIRIADNGPGIPDEQQEALFDKGIHGIQSDGTGIGLFLVQTLIEQYGGDIHVEDNEPEGAVFVVHLPLAE